MRALLPVCALAVFNAKAVLPYPVSENAIEQYPYSTVGMLSAGSFTGSGTAVASRVVISAAHVFYDDSEGALIDAPFEWYRGFDSRQSTNVEAATARAWTVYDDYASAVEDFGSASAQAFNRDIIVLQFLNDIAGVVTASWVINALQNDDFRMYIGYPSGLYAGFDARAGQMHASAGGELIYSDFSRFSNASGLTRFYNTGELTTASGNSGGPLFAYNNGNWAVSGVVVSSEAFGGTSGVAMIDNSVDLMISQAISQTNSNTVEPSNIVDTNADSQGATELILNQARMSTIAPNGDVDTHKFTISEEGIYTIESLGTLDVAGSLLSSNGQLIASNDDSQGSTNYKIESFLLPGEYYIRTTPFSAVDVGAYGVLVSQQENTTVYDDAGVSADEVVNLPLNSQGLYRLESIGKTDAYQIQVNEAGRYMITTQGTLDIFAFLFVSVPGATPAYDESEIQEMIITSDNGPATEGNALMDVYLQPGQYTLAIMPRSALEMGDYRLVTQFYADLQQSTEADDTDDSLAAANVLFAGDYSFDFSGDGDLDSFYFDIEQTANVSVTISAGSGFLVKLYNANLDRLLSEDAAVGNAASTYSTNWLLEPGRYYLSLMGTAAESYQLSIQ